MWEIAVIHDIVQHFMSVDKITIVSEIIDLEVWDGASSCASYLVLQFRCTLEYDSKLPSGASTIKTDPVSDD